MDGTTAGCCSSNAYFGTLHYRDTLLTVVLFAILGTALGLIVRSTVPAVAIAVPWMTPLEHIVQGVWADAGRWFPGLLLNAITRSGTDLASYDRSVFLGLDYTAALALVAASFLRRDVTT
jgi:ABC-2 type transport system permease protein